MDTRTGRIYEMETGESVDQLAARLGGAPKDFVPVARKADGSILPRAVTTSNWT